MRQSTLFLFPALAALAAAQTNTQTVTATATQTGSVMTIQSTVQSLTTVYPTTAQSEFEGIFECCFHVPTIFGGHGHCRARGQACVLRTIKTYCIPMSFARNHSSDLVYVNPIVHLLQKADRWGFPQRKIAAQTTVTATGQTATVVPTAGANLLSIEAPVVGIMVGCALGMAFL
jgi:hypothetical protein